MKYEYIDVKKYNTLQTALLIAPLTRMNKACVSGER